MSNVPVLQRLGPKAGSAEISKEMEKVRLWLTTLSRSGGVVAAQDIATQISEAIAATPDSAGSYESPTAPTGLTATGLFGKIFLQWDAPAYTGHAYTEVYRHTEDNQANAVLVGRAFDPDAFYVDDSIPETSISVTYYYWIRHVNINSDAGAFNAPSGVAGATADDPDYLLEIASEKWQANHDYAVGDLVMPTRPNGYVYEVTVDGGASAAAEPAWPTVIDDTVADGDLTWKCKAEFSFETFFKVALVDGVPKLTLKEIFLADAIIKRAMIDDLAVNDAKVENLSVAKLIAGIITASNIFLGSDSKMHLDGANQRIDVTDANGVLRVRLGNLGAGLADWGIQIWDSSGTLILSSGAGMDYSFITNLMGISSNQLQNGAFVNDTSGWASYWAGGTFNWGHNFSADYTLAGEGTAWLSQTGTDAYSGLIYYQNFIPVIAGKRYEFYGYTGAHRCIVDTVIEWYDSSGLFLSSSVLGQNDEEAGGWTYLGAYKQTGGFATAPANATQARPVFRKNATKAGQADSYMFVCRAYFGEAQANQTQFSAWSDGAPSGAFAMLDVITAANISTYIAGAAIGTVAIRDAAIVTAKVADLSMTTGKIADNAISAINSVSGTAATISTNLNIPSGETWKIVAQGYQDYYYIGEYLSYTTPYTLTVTIDGNSKVVTGFPHPNGGGTYAYWYATNLSGDHHFEVSGPKTVTVSLTGKDGTNKSLVAQGYKK